MYPRLVPRDRERYRSVEQHVKVIRVVRLLKKVIDVENDILAYPLLRPDVVLVAVTRLERCNRNVAENSIRQTVAARRTRKDEVLVIRCFKISRIRRPHHRLGRLEHIRNAEPRLQRTAAAETPIIVVSETETQAQAVPKVQRVLRV